MLGMCYPYSVTITCVCDSDNQVINCFPTRGRGKQEGGGREKMSLARRDNITEILLATTALVVVIALFCR